MIQRVVQENVSAQTVRLDLFVRLLDSMFENAIGTQDSSIPTTVLFASVLKVRQSARAVQLLSNESCVEEILSIGRTLVEVTVNACYLQFAGERELARYLQFHPASQFAQLGNSQSGRGATSAITRKLTQFLSNHRSLAAENNADPSWTTRTLMDRAHLSDEASNIPIMAHLVTRCYAKGHAAVHGTVDSLEHFASTLNASAPPRPETRMAALSEALFGVNLTLLTFCIYLNDYFRLGMDEGIEEAAHADASTRPRLEGR